LPGARYLGKELEEANRCVSRPVTSSSTAGLFILGSVALCIMMGEGAMADWSFHNTIQNKAPK
jgi:hypothetical protein